MGGREEGLAWMVPSKEVEPDKEIVLKWKSENLEEREKGVRAIRRAGI